jgi:hypothetical protein
MAIMHDLSNYEEGDTLIVRPVIVDVNEPNSNGCMLIDDYHHYKTRLLSCILSTFINKEFKIMILPIKFYIFLAVNNYDPSLSSNKAIKITLGKDGYHDNDYKFVESEEYCYNSSELIETSIKKIIRHHK